jgi:hypothetical protein
MLSPKYPIFSPDNPTAGHTKAVLVAVVYSGNASLRRSRSGKLRALYRSGTT